jgi:nitrate reductase cytochrome c-type subunit
MRWAERTASTPEPARVPRSSHACRRTRSRAHAIAPYAMQPPGTDPAPRDRPGYQLALRMRHTAACRATRARGSRRPVRDPRLPATHYMGPPDARLPGEVSIADATFSTQCHALTQDEGNGARRRTATRNLAIRCGGPPRRKRGIGQWRQGKPRPKKRRLRCIGRLKSAAGSFFGKVHERAPSRSFQASRLPHRGRFIALPSSSGAASMLRSEPTTY